MIRRKKVDKKEKDAKVKAPHKFVATKYPPLTSKEELKRTVKQQNALNKQRSKAMENKVAKILRGRRVLLSGAAAAYKGDVEVPLKNYPGNFIVECKLSAQLAGDQPFIYLHLSWFGKMHEEAKSMGSKFAVLVVNFLGHRRDYVFIRKDVVTKLIYKYDSPYGKVLEHLMENAPVLSWLHMKSGKERTGYKVYRRELEENMSTVDSMQGVRVIVPDGEYLVLHLDTFATAIAHM